jgi:hypothetical protein
MKNRLPAINDTRNWRLSVSTRQIVFYKKKFQKAPPRINDTQSQFSIANISANLNQKSQKEKAFV